MKDYVFILKRGKEKEVWHKFGTHHEYLSELSRAIHPFLADNYEVTIKSQNVDKPNLQYSNHWESLIKVKKVKKNA